MCADQLVRLELRDAPLDFCTFPPCRSISSSGTYRQEEHEVFALAPTAGGLLGPFLVDHAMIHTTSEAVWMLVKVQFSPMKNGAHPTMHSNPCLP